MMNVVVLQGRMVKDADMRSTTNGTMVANFCLAVDRDYVKQGEDRKADFINCTAWGKTAEFVGKYFQKGTQMLLKGRIATEQYQDKETGKNRTSTGVTVESVNFCEGKKDAVHGKVEQQEFEPVGDDDEDLPF